SARQARPARPRRPASRAPGVHRLLLRPAPAFRGSPRARIAAPGDRPAAAAAALVSLDDGADRLRVGGFAHASVVDTARMESPSRSKAPFPVMPLVAMGLGVLILANDFSALNVALPQIERDFDAQVSTVQWVVNAYALVFGVLIVSGGRLADLF